MPPQKRAHIDDIAGNKSQRPAADNLASWNECALPLRVVIGTYAGAVFGIETLRTVNQLCAHDAEDKTAEPPQVIDDADDGDERDVVDDSADEGMDEDAVIDRTPPPPPPPPLPPSDFRPLFTVTDHLSCITAIAVSRNGARMCTASTDETIQLYDTRKLRHTGALAIHSHSVTALALHDDTHLFSGDDSGALLVSCAAPKWSVGGELVGHKKRINAITIHPTGKVAMAVSNDCAVKMFDCVTGKCATTMHTRKPPSIIRWAPNGLLYALVVDKTLTLYDLNGAVVRLITAESAIKCLTFLTANVALIGCENGHILLESPTNTLAVMKHYSVRVKSIDCIVMQDSTIAPDDDKHTRYIVMTATSDGQVKLWDMTDIAQRVTSDTKSNFDEQVAALKPVAQVLSDHRVTFATILPQTRPQSAAHAVIQHTSALVGSELTETKAVNKSNGAAHVEAKTAVQSSVTTSRRDKKRQREDASRVPTQKKGVTSNKKPTSNGREKNVATNNQTLSKRRANADRPQSFTLTNHKRRARPQEE